MEIKASHSYGNYEDAAYFKDDVSSHLRSSLISFL